MSGAPDEFQYDVSKAIRTVAMALPGATEGQSCVNRAFKAGGKNFAFLGEKDGECGLRLKLDTSIDEVAGRAESQPDRYQVGTNGWTMLRFPPDDPPMANELEAWIVESFRLLAPAKIVATLDDTS